MGAISNVDEIDILLHYKFDSELFGEHYFNQKKDTP